MSITKTEVLVNNNELNDIITNNQSIKGVSMSITKTTKTEVKAISAKAPATTTTPVAEVKAAKPEIVIKDLKLSKEIIVKEMKSCVSFVNAKGDKWYLKGHTLEITNLDLPTLKDRITPFTKEQIAKCHLGHSKGLIKNVIDTKDLETILKSFKVSEPKATKEVKVEEIKA